MAEAKSKCATMLHFAVLKASNKMKSGEPYDPKIIADELTAAAF